MKSCDGQVQVVKPEWRRDDEMHHIATGAAATTSVDDDEDGNLRAVCLVRAIAVDVVEVDVCGVLLVLVDGCGWRM